MCYQASHTQPVQNGLLFPRSRPPPSTPATPATGTTVYLRAQTRNLVLIRDSSLSFSPHSINKYCQLYLQRISQEATVSSVTTSQASSPPLHDALVSYMVFPASPCTSPSQTPANTAREWGLPDLKVHIRFPLDQGFSTFTLIFGAR